MKRGTLKQSFAWAIVTTDGKLALFTGQCPIYWLRQVAQRECNQRTRTAKDDEAYHVEKVSIVPVYR